MRPADTSKEAWARMEAGVHAMTPGERVRRAAALTVLAHRMALSQIRAHYPHESERRHRLRLAARYLDPEAMRAAFDWPDY